ncbi:MAG: hypothetical protein AAFS10_05395, partial [Myxococcota bacterium]
MGSAHQRRYRRERMDWTRGGTVRFSRPTAVRVALLSAALGMMISCSDEPSRSDTLSMDTSMTMESDEDGHNVQEDTHDSSPQDSHQDTLADSSQEDEGATTGDTTVAPDSPAPMGTVPLMAWDGEDDAFFDRPWPSDMRLTAQGTPDWTGFPNPTHNSTVTDIVATAGERRGFPVTSLAWFRFSGPLTPHLLDDVVLPEAMATAPAMVVDIDPDSPERGRVFPTVLQTLEPDPYTPAWVLAVAPRPGFVLAPERTYAVVLTHHLHDRDGTPVEAALGWEELFPEASGGSDRIQQARALYAPLWPTLDRIGVERSTVVAATVFTTGDVVADMAAMGDAVTAAHTWVMEQAPRLDPDDGAAHPRMCELHGALRLPQFQQGTPPFDTEGLFAFAQPGDLLPIQQGEAVVPFAITLPKQPMPSGGYPLVLYFHGSGGLSTQVIDRGPVLEPGGERQPGLGPSHVLAQHGLATAGYALPVNAERLPGASSLDYINFFNLVSYRDNMRQGTLEQRLVLDALLDLRIPPEALAACPGPELPADETAFRFSAAPIMAMGQSQGA